MASSFHRASSVDECRGGVRVGVVCDGGSGECTRIQQ